MTMKLEEWMAALRAGHKPTEEEAAKGRFPWQGSKGALASQPTLSVTGFGKGTYNVSKAPIIPTPKPMKERVFNEPNLLYGASNELLRVANPTELPRPENVDAADLVDEPTVRQMLRDAEKRHGGDLYRESDVDEWIRKSTAPEAILARSNQAALKQADEALKTGADYFKAQNDKFAVLGDDTDTVEGEAKVDAEREWVRQTKLSRPQCSLWHKVQEAVKRHEIVLSTGLSEAVYPKPIDHDALEYWVMHGIPYLDASEAPKLPEQIFLIDHDWAGLIEGAVTDGKGGEWRLPYQRCVFEVMADGHHLLALVTEYKEKENENSANPKMPTLVFQKVGKDRFGLFPPCSLLYNGEVSILGSNAGMSIGALMGRQVRAAAIALEAEIVERQVVRAPHKLNSIRAKRGQLPLLDYHTLDLARRSNVAKRLDPLDPTRVIHHQRLHLRRGHWRHFATFKTYIRWCLAGDPSLGVVIKDYRL